MQNRTFLLLFRPIFGEKLKTVPPKGNWMPKLWCRCRDSLWKSVWISDFGLKIRLNFGVDLFFCFGDHLFLGWKIVWTSDFGRKIRLNFGEDLFFFFFFGDHLFLSGENVWISELSEKFRLKYKPWETDSIIMKIRVKFLCTFLTLSKEPPPFPNPGYAPDPNI